MSYNVGVDGNVNRYFVSIRENEYDKDGKSISETFYSVFKDKNRTSLRYKFDYNDKRNLVAKISLDEKGEIKSIIYIEENETERKFTSTKGVEVNYVVVEHKEKNRVVSSSNLDLKNRKITGTTKYKFDKSDTVWAGILVHETNILTLKLWNEINIIIRQKYT